MKRKWPEWLVYLMPMALLCAVIGMFLFYLLGYWFYSNGVTANEMYVFLLLPTLLFFSVTGVGHYFLLRQYRLECFEENRKPYTGWVIFIILSLAVFVLGLGIDWLYYQVDPYISRGFGKALEEMLVGAGESRESVLPITQMPLYTQNYVGAVIGILAGTLLAVWIVTVRIRKPSQHRFT